MSMLSISDGPGIATPDEEVRSQIVGTAPRGRSVSPPPPDNTSEHVYLIPPQENRLSSTVVGPIHYVANEPFELVRDSEGVWLRHETWSLLGSGQTLLEAEQDLLEEARELAEIYLHLPPASLDAEAYRLRNFLMDIL